VSNLATIEAKAFVPARDFALSKRFYQDLGFGLAWSDDDLAYLRHGNSSFLLQNFYNAAHAGNFMMHLLVENVDAWWRHVEAQGIAAKYGVKTEPWGIRDFLLVDPTGVLWRIGENISLTSSRVRGEVERSEGEGQH
jgi:catechol 2,3-dioxygenase-like lactoylglutathione lyase family enzyme